MSRELICDFFIKFSRFEYALKASGRAREGSTGGAEADWSDVEAALRGLDRQRLRALAGILLVEPPRKQTVDSQGRLGWRVAGPSGDDSQNLVVALKRVRNNLFHGGKYEQGNVMLSDRSQRLVAQANALLDELLQLEALRTVAERFYGYDPAEG